MHIMSRGQERGIYPTFPINSTILTIALVVQQGSPDLYSLSYLQPLL